MNDGMEKWIEYDEELSERSFSVWKRNKEKSEWSK